MFLNNVVVHVNEYFRESHLLKQKKANQQMTK